MDKVDEKAEEVKDKIGEKKKEILLKDEVLEPDPILTQEPFLKALNTLSK